MATPAARLRERLEARRRDRERSATDLRVALDERRRTTFAERYRTKRAFAGLAPERAAADVLPAPPTGPIAPPSPDAFPPTVSPGPTPGEEALAAAERRALEGVPIPLPLPGGATAVVTTGQLRTLLPGATPATKTELAVGRLLARLPGALGEFGESVAARGEFHKAQEAYAAEQVPLPLRLPAELANLALELEVGARIPGPIGRAIGAGSRERIPGIRPLFPGGEVTIGGSTAARIARSAGVEARRFGTLEAVEGVAQQQPGEETLTNVLAGAASGGAFGTVAQGVREGIARAVAARLGAKVEPRMRRPALPPPRIEVEPPRAPPPTPTPPKPPEEVIMRQEPPPPPPRPAGPVAERPAVAAPDGYEARVARAAALSAQQDRTPEERAELQTLHEEIMARGAAYVEEAGQAPAPTPGAVAAAEERRRTPRPQPALDIAARHPPEQRAADLRQQVAARLGGQAPVPEPATAPRPAPPLPQAPPSAGVGTPAPPAERAPPAPISVAPEVRPPEQVQGGAAPAVQRTIEESGTPASEADLENLVDAAKRLLMYERSPTGAPFPRDPRAVREWATKVLGRPYESGTWRTDDAYDAIEAAINPFVRDEVHTVPTGEVQMRRYVERVRQLEESTLGTRTRSEGMVARQQFSTPLPIAAAAQFALNVQPGEKVLEPTAGTGNLIGLLPEGVEIRANEVDPRRAALLRLLGHTPTTEDALGLYLSGLRVNAVVTNPPFGGTNLPKYRALAAKGALPFPASDVSQRFVYAALQSLADNGRLVAIMPEGMMGKAASPFRVWLRANYEVVAIIEAPAGSYATRGTEFGTWMLVVDNTGPAVRPAIEVTQPSWEQWTDAVLRLGGTGDLARPGGHEPVADVAPIAGAAPARAPVRPAPLASPVSTATDSPIAAAAQEIAAAVKDAIKEAIRGPVQPAGGAEPAAAGELAGGDRPPPPRAGGGERGAGLGRPAPEPGRRAAPGAERRADVVAEPPPGERGGAEPRAAPALVPRLARRRVEPRPGDSAERRAELAAANDSPVFAPYARGIPHERNPHPRLVVETRSMAGMPAPPVTVTRFTSPLVDRAWGRPGEAGGISDDQAEAALRALSAWDKGHGFLFADDVGVGKTREAAILILEALARGKQRILYTTKNENNVADVMRELRLVASGTEEGEFPAAFVIGSDYPNAMTRKARQRTEGLPEPVGPAVYLVHSYNFEPLGQSLRDIPFDTWMGDEAHEYKNQFAERGMAWQALHKQLLERDGLFAYFTATPAVTLDELGYLYGLKEWRPGGFADWVRRKMGKEPSDSAADDAAERDAETERIRTEIQTGESAGIASASELDELATKGKRQFMRGRPDVFAVKITPAETEQVMRELKGAGKYLARDLWRGGVKFAVHEVDLLGAGTEAVAARARYDAAASLGRDITMAARRFGYLNKQTKTVGLERAMIQSYLKQVLFDLRLPTVLRLGKEALAKGQQVVISVHSVAGDVDLEEGLTVEESQVPLNKRMESAINRINTRQVEKQGQGDEVEYIDLGEIPEALAVRAELLDRLAALPHLVDPVRQIEETFGPKTVAAITGKVGAKRRTQIMHEFQTGKRTVALISKAGKVGISLHDVNGKARRMIVGDYEWSADLFKQELGRVDRTGQRSSPEVILVASNIAGERKFAATIAARMASLGATSKGSAEATGTDALDQFEMSGDLATAAMKNAIEHLDDDLRAFFTGSKFVESRESGRGERLFVPKRRPDDADMRSFLLEMLLFPVEASHRVLTRWVAERDALMTGEAIEAAAARRTGRTSGTVLRVTDLVQDPALTMYEVENDAGEHRAILQGFVTEHIGNLQGIRGTDESGNKRARRYVHFSDKSGELISGLEVNAAEARRIRVFYKAGEHVALTPDQAWEELQAGDDVRVEGPAGAPWVLHPRRDGRLQIRGATVAKNRDDLRGYAKYEPVGNYLYVDNERAAVQKFLARFPTERPVVATPTQKLIDHVRAQVQQLEAQGHRDFIGDATRRRLLEQLDRVANLQGTPSDEEIVELAIQHSILDDVTIDDLKKTINPLLNLPAGLQLEHLTAAEVAARLAADGPPPGTAGGPRVLAEGFPRRAGFIENWFMPPSRLAARLRQSPKASERQLGEQLGRIFDEGQRAQERFARVIHFGSNILKQATKGLSKSEQRTLVDAWTAAEAAGVRTLALGTPPKIVAAYEQLEGALVQTWRWLGENERVMLSEQKRALLDAATEEWPEGSPEWQPGRYGPDGEILDPGTFDTTPVNRANIMAAAARLGRGTEVPTTREGWERLYQHLRDARKRVQRPAFLDSPDLRRIFDMGQGRGSLAAYFPHVFRGPWVVRAGERTARFVDRDEAILYARQLLEREGWPDDIPILYEAWMPEAELYLSRKAYFRLRTTLEQAAGEEAAVVGIERGKIRIRPRRRFYSHLQHRAVNLQTFDRELVPALRTYFYRTAKKLAFDPFRKVALDERDRLPFEGNWRAVADSYMADIQGVPHEWVEHINATIERALGGHMKPFFLQRASSRWQHVMGWWHLGGLPGIPTISAAVNLTQTIINTPAAFPKEGVKWTLVGARELAQWSAESKDVVDRLGITLIHPQYVGGEYLPRGVGISEDSFFSLMYYFNKSEDVNRAIAGLAKYAERRAAGTGKAEALEAARRLVYDAHFDYSIADAPRIMRNPIGRAVLQFKLFPINELLFAESLFRWGTWRQRAYFTSALGVLGGVRLLALATPLFVLNWLLGQTGFFRDDATGEKQTPYEALWEELRKAGVHVQADALARAVKYGLLGLFGVQVSERVGFAGPRDVRDTLIQSKYRQLAAALTAKNPTERERAIRGILPLAVKRLWAAIEAAETGKVRDRFGRVVDDSVSLTDIVGQGVGIGTVEQAERYERLDRERQTTEAYRRQRSDFVDRGARAVRAGDQAAVQRILDAARARGITITRRQLVERLETLDQADIKRRVGRTPTDIRDELFSEEERRGTGRRRLPPGAPRPSTPRRP